MGGACIFSPPIASSPPHLTPIRKNSHRSHHQPSTLPPLPPLPLPPLPPPLPFPCGTLTLTPSGKSATHSPSLHSTPTPCALPLASLKNLVPTTPSPSLPSVNTTPFSLTHHLTPSSRILLSTSTSTTTSASLLIPLTTSPASGTPVLQCTWFRPIAFNPPLATMSGQKAKYVPCTTVRGTATLPSGTFPSASGMASGRSNPPSLSSLMLCPWFARMSQCDGSVDDSSSDGFVAGLGRSEKRCLSESRTAARISAKVGARVRMGGHWSCAARQYLRWRGEGEGRRIAYDFGQVGVAFLVEGDAGGRGLVAQEAGEGAREGDVSGSGPAAGAAAAAAGAEAVAAIAAAAMGGGVAVLFGELRGGVGVHGGRGVEGGGRGW